MYFRMTDVVTLSIKLELGWGMHNQADYCHLSSDRFTASPPLLSEAVVKLRDKLPSEKPETLGTIYSTPAASDVLKYIRRGILRTMKKGR